MNDGKQTPNSFAIVPAAGHSRRFRDENGTESDKLLAAFRGQPLIGSLILAWRRSQIGRIVVVVRGTNHALIEFVSSFDVDLIIPPVDPAEMKHSIQFALRHIESKYQPAESAAWLLAPADSPHLSSSVVDQLLRIHAESQQPHILIPTCGDQRGHPVLFPWFIAQHVHELPADAGVNAIWKQHPSEFISVDDPRVLTDVDTRTDMQRLAESPPDRPDESRDSN